MLMRNLFLVSVSLVLASCAHHKDVRAGADGIHRVVVRAGDRDGAERKAIKEANHYCEDEQNDKHAAFITEDTKYTGSMDEGTRDTLKKASTAAAVIGGMHRKSPAGDVLGSAGTAGYIMTNGKDYVADMKFKCQ